MPESEYDRLIRRQHETWNRMCEIEDQAKTDGWTDERRQNWDAADDDLTKIDGDLARMARMNERNQVDRSQILDASGQPADPSGETRSAEELAEEYRDAFWACMRRGISNVSARHRELLEANHTDHPEVRAAGQGSDPAGGFLVPPEFRNQIFEVVKSFGGMLEHCHQITTETGANLSWPTNDDTMNEGIEIAENTQISEQDVVFGQRQIGAITFTSKMVRVPWNLLNDSAFDLEDFLTRKFGERLGRIYARRLLTGTGVGQPLGVAAASRVGQPGGLTVGATGPTGSPAVRFDDFVDLEHSIDPAYRNSGRARYGMSDGTLKIARKVKDADGRPLWQPIPAPGFPATINGFPYFVDNSMAVPAAGGVGAIFGDFYAGMLVRIVQGFQSVQLRERYADFLQTGFFAYSRMDAKPDDVNALAALKFGPAS